MKTLALFDFDGTITKDDSFLKFIRFVVGDKRFAVGFVVLLPVLLLYKLKLIPNYRAKQMVLAYFFEGTDRAEFLQVAKVYSLNHIDKIVRPKAMEKIFWHKNQGHKVVVVSASLECWLAPWCAKMGLDLIATRLDSSPNLITAKFATPNCFGIEKANRIRANYDLSTYQKIYAYGDSAGDKEMLALADESFYKPFRD